MRKNRISVGTKKIRTKKTTYLKKIILKMNTKKWKKEETEKIKNRKKLQKYKNRIQKKQEQNKSLRKKVRPRNIRGIKNIRDSSTQKEQNGPYLHCKWPQFAWKLKYWNMYHAGTMQIIQFSCQFKSIFKLIEARFVHLLSKMRIYRHQSMHK